ncbi:TonB-dependent receptor plug domain-containing protein [Shimia sp. R11_0]|uniref:TonB-dependent receptor plug domain-containing protein n=1 Tax=Shimia sp. R11_0 TaxID=2821096 RepID=UPI001ADD38C2|nr:TonB-dependent receptor plug domain-containing protein [Shimia sp. R11_0]MBO9477509.1 TonB-dependent receptor plug domain-containing protein [Shimia sp. R11_0]
MRHSSVRALLFTSTMLVAAPFAAPFAMAQSATDLDDIVVGVPTEEAEGQTSGEGTDDGGIASNTIDEDDPANSGTSTLGQDSILLRGNGQDANSALVGLPNVHYRSDVNEDGEVNDDVGEGADDVLDLQPQEISISGARVNENNIMIDGIGINSVVTPASPSTQGDESVVPDLLGFYGGHSQTQYVPSSMVEQVEVMDSNVSAEYGGFLGGSVNYKLRKPDLEEARGALSYSFQSDDFAKYSLGTEDKENPNNRAKPKWTKQNFSLDYSTPVSENTAVMFGYSTQRATAEKQRAPQFGSEVVDSKSRSDFYRFALTHELDNGDRLTGSLNYTDYDQDWKLENTRDVKLDIQNQALLGEVGYERDIGNLWFMRNATLDLGVNLQRNEIANTQDENQQFNWIGMDRNGNDLSAGIEGCDPVAGGGVQMCQTGGTGSKYFQDNRIGLDAKVSGEVGNGTFKSGIDLEYYDVNRRGEAVEYYTSTFANTAGNCNPGDPSCTAEQYFWARQTIDAYNMDVTASKVGAYAEIDQTFGDFFLRGGLRMDYNDVLENVDIAPRLSATWAPSDGFSLTVGANRYYDDNYLAYAVQDALPRTRMGLRFGDPTLPWNETFNGGETSYSGRGLDTPYNDELSVALGIKDRFTNGFWRVRALQRKGKDLFTNEGTSTSPTLTNGGESDYKSLVLEYQKTWQPTNIPHLNNLGIYTSLTWSDSNRVGGTYFATPSQESRDVWYNGQAYNRSAWDETLGNLDQPFRATAEIRSQWFDGGMSLGLVADFTDAYSGVLYDGVTRPDPNGPLYSEYKDHRFKKYVLFNLNASFKVAEVGNGNDLMLDVQVNNLFDRMPSGTASDTSPWVRGRTVWVGTNLTF